MTFPNERIFIFPLPVPIKAKWFVMIYAGIIALKAFPKSSHLFMMGVACNFIIWLKVSTDLLPFLALFATLAFLTSDIDYIRITQNPEDPEKTEEPVPAPKE